MIHKLEIAAQHTELTPELKKYVHKKIGRIDRYAPRNVRESLHAEVWLKGETKHKGQFTCNVVLHVPDETLEASETTINMFAAIDIVETKLKQQLTKYKDLHSSPKTHRRLFSRFSRKSSY